jgi:uncharacterized protein
MSVTSHVGYIAIGAFWSERPAVEIDAVALAGRREEAVLLGEAKWARTVNGARIVGELERKSSALPLLAPNPTYAICARERITNLPPAATAITAAEIFA